MRKRYWVLLAIMAFGGAGNLIGGTDTPARATVDATGTPGRQYSPVTQTPQFDATMYVSADTLNLRVEPLTSARILVKLPRNSRISAGERRNGWVQVSVNGKIGWVSSDYLSASPSAPAISRPVQSAPSQQLVQQGTQSCPSRRYCTQIGSCEEAQFYLANCSWGYRLDADNDGVPCESICR